MKKEINRILIITILLNIIGIIMIYSASNIWAEYKYNDSFYFLKYQVIFSIVSYISLYTISKINYKLYYKHNNKIIFICIILLLIVLIPGLGVMRNGSRSWFKIGSLGFQPSELSKIGLIMFTSKYLNKNRNNINNFKSGLLPLIFIIIIVFGLIMLEPDMGSASVLVLSIVILILSSEIKLSYLYYLIIFGIISLSILIIIAPYRIQRIVAFLNPWSDPLGSGFQIIQSLYAIGPGGVLGLGFGNSIQKQFYLPEPQTDFIFSIICEELGIIGALFILTLFFLLFKNILKVALKTNDLFGKYLTLGLGILIMLQSILNISVVIGLIPVTGVTLPFISYGGSSLLISMISIGIIINIAKNN